MKKTQVVSLDYLLSLLVVTYLLGYSIQVLDEAYYLFGKATKENDMLSVARMVSLKILSEDSPGEIEFEKLSWMRHEAYPYHVCVNVSLPTGWQVFGDCEMSLSENVVVVKNPFVSKASVLMGECLAWNGSTALGCNTSSFSSGSCGFDTIDACGSTPDLEWSVGYDFDQDSVCLYANITMLPVGTNFSGGYNVWLKNAEFELDDNVKDNVTVWSTGVVKNYPLYLVGDSYEGDYRVVCFEIERYVGHVEVSVHD